MPKARPDHFRFRLWDSAMGSTPLDLPPRRMRGAGVVLAIFFAIFAAIEWVMILKMRLHDVHGVFDLMFLLFEAFWVLGWSVGVFILGALTVLFLFYGESAHIKNGRLVHVPRLGPLRIVCEYDLGRIGNVRLEPTKQGDNVRIRFDYRGGTNGIGDAMPHAQAERIAEVIRTAAARNKSGVDSGEAAPASRPEAEGTRQQRPMRHSGAPLNPGDSGVSASGLVLVGVNMLPLAGVLLFDWSLANVVLLYWAESALIGFYTVLKICVVGKAAAVVAVPFFVGHFGGFMAAHFMFVYGFFVREWDTTGPEPSAMEALAGLFGPLWLTLIALAVSHGVSFVVNFIGQREYEGTTVSKLMAAPYKRILVMHLTVIFGGWLVMAFETPAPVLLLLVVLKAAADFRAHAKEHTAAPVGQSMAPAAGSGP
jgi:hypothetical protein